MNDTASKLRKLIAAATPAAIERKRAMLAAAQADLARLEAACENERARFARALVIKRAAALARMEAAARIAA